ncbi:4-hydroxybenzoate octaprenyltransferase [Pseudobythopirellula maris]|uniref:4-hydroxybenzoate polyprenyltransferase n=1 Tax=Pseudobythopirellula maris TaxID=2527991 RepID=A0A5C5ZJ93_9BACT|nr:4-hydroxybenzoate octaprenyltransferase [Pseudobythopirellula maris]TWT87419.1 4-hydroxybenzoate octaprenyltransferase [Pseudobythopirellula maris]
MLPTIRHLLTLIRFSHTLFALPFALLAMLMAGRKLRLVFAKGIVYPDPSKDWHDYDSALPYWSALWNDFGYFMIQWEEVYGVLLCMVFARSTAMAFNRIADRKIDAENPRTAARHLPAGVLSLPQVSVFALLSATGFIASTLLFLPNWLPAALSVPVILWLCGYSYAKRFTSLAQFWLGAALGLSPVAAWIAIRGQAVMADPWDLLPAAILGAAVLTWVAGFDTLYACQDYEHDKSAGLRSVPTALGVPGALRLAAVLHALTVVLLALVPLAFPPFGMIYWGGVVAIALLLVYEHRLVRPDDLSRVNLAFFHVNAVVSLGLLVIGTVDLLV